MLALSFSLALAFYFCAPFVIGSKLKGRFGGSWWIFAVGALSFAFSQVVHIPMLHLIGALDLPPPPPAWQLPIQGAIVGLAAGLCEEWARYVAFKLVLTKQRSFGDALVAGAGHGGIEAFLLGAMLAASLITSFAFSRAGFDQLGLPADQVPVAQAQVNAMFELPAYLPLIGVLERSVIIPLHIALSTLVAYGVRLGRLWPVWLAVLLHALVDAPVVFLTPGVFELGNVVAYVGILIMAAVVLVWMSRKQEAA